MKLEKALKDLSKQEIQLQARPLPPPMDLSTSMPDYFENMDTDVDGTSGEGLGATKDEELLDYTVSDYSLSDPRETDLEKELNEKIRGGKGCASKAMHGLGKKNITLSMHSLSYARSASCRLSYAQFAIPIVGGYEQVLVQDYKVAEIEKDQSKWHVSWLTKHAKNKLFYLAAPRELKIDPNFFPIKRRRNWDTFQQTTSNTKMTWLNYQELPEPKRGSEPSLKST